MYGYEVDMKRQVRRLRLWVRSVNEAAGEEAVYGYEVCVYVWVL